VAGEGFSVPDDVHEKKSGGCDELHLVTAGKEQPLDVPERIGRERDVGLAVEAAQDDPGLTRDARAIHDDLGVEEALKGNPDYILVVNDDTVFDARFLKEMIATAEANPRAVVGSLLLSWDQPHRVFQVAPRWDTWHGGWRHYFDQTVWTMPKREFEVELIVGNCTLFPAAAFREEGLFATRWLPHYGDAEFTPRLRRRGWKLLIQPSARVFNQPNEIPPRMSQMSFRELYSVCWSNYNHAHNLRNRFLMYWLGAPTKVQACAAFGIHCARLLLQAVGIRFSRRGEQPMYREYAGDPCR